MTVAAESGQPSVSANPSHSAAVDLEISPLRILLVGNYKEDRQWSMLGFSQALETGLSASHSVRLIQPKAYFGSLPVARGPLQKWFGYLDKYVIFPFELVRQARWADIVHICDQANAPYVCRIARTPHIVNCHDTLAIRCALGAYPERSIRFTGRVYQRWILNGLRRAAQIVCVSPATAADLLSLGGIREERVGVVDNGLNYPYAPMDADEAWQRAVPLGLARGTEFFLHVGSNDWYKNREGLLQIFSELCARSGRDFALVLAGPPLPTELKQLAIELGIEGSVLYFENLGNEDLRALYSVAQALLVPSLQEGFGLPVIEAQACGCPVFASARGPLPYVGGAAAVYFDPKNFPEAAQTILSHRSHGEEMREAGLINARRFTRAAMIAGYVAQYRAVLDRESVANDGRAGRKSA
jgi:glycosyltransferase involved in cell wall biosynthesis